MRMKLLRSTGNRCADQSSNGFSWRGNASNTPALALAFSACERRKIIAQPSTGTAPHPAAVGEPENTTRPRLQDRSLGGRRSHQIPAVAVQVEEHGDGA